MSWEGAGSAGGLFPVFPGVAVPARRQGGGARRRSHYRDYGTRCPGAFFKLRNLTSHFMTESWWGGQVMCQ